MKTKAPHVPAAFINAIAAEEGTKEEAVRYLQETWNDYRQAVKERDEAKAQRGTLLGEGSTLGAFTYSPLGEQLVAMEQRAVAAERDRDELIEALRLSRQIIDRGGAHWGDISAIEKIDALLARLFPPKDAAA